jgi:protein-tyrosine phosphatase
MQGQGMRVGDGDDEGETSMGLLDRLLRIGRRASSEGSAASAHVEVEPIELAADGRSLLLPNIANLRELGGYDTPDGPTKSHRFLRSASTRMLAPADRRRLYAYGLTHVLDLRGQFERPSETCSFSREQGVVWKNVEFYHADLTQQPWDMDDSAGELDFHVHAYLSMLANRQTVREVVGFLASVPADECALFHCAAGMDRTGVTSMLLLGAAGVSRDDITRDYLYSFATVAEVERYLRTGELPRSLFGRMASLVDVMGQVYDQLIRTYGSVGDYLLSCDLTPDELDALRTRLLG